VALLKIQQRTPVHPETRIMRPDKLLEHVRRQPFQPFRLFLTNGEHFDVAHPELIVVTMREVVVAKSTRRGAVPESSVMIDPMHITHLEPLNGAKKSSPRKPRKQ